MARKIKTWEVIVVGGGIAGLSAAIYLGRARRDCLVIDSRNSMARWEPDVQNYLGFPEGVSGPQLLWRGQRHAKRYGAALVADKVLSARKRSGIFYVRCRRRSYRCQNLLLATGIFHIPPAINGVKACLGHSMFFCKDCDGMRVRGKRIAIYGANDEAAEYALAMGAYTGHVAIVTNQAALRWSKRHARRVRQYRIPVYTKRITRAVHRGCHLKSLQFADGQKLLVEALFTTRGDIYHNEIAKALGAKIDRGEIVVDACQRSSVKGLYAAGCVTPANCQMIIAAGQGAAAAQAINRDLFESSLTGPASTGILNRLGAQADTGEI